MKVELLLRFMSVLAQNKCLKDIAYAFLKALNFLNGQDRHVLR